MPTLSIISVTAVPSKPFVLNSASAASNISFLRSSAFFVFFFVYSFIRPSTDRQSIAYINTIYLRCQSFFSPIKKRLSEHMFKKSLGALMMLLWVAYEISQLVLWESHGKNSAKYKHSYTL